MTILDTLLIAFIYLIIPTSTILFFFRTQHKMIENRTQNPPTLELFMVLVIYCMLLLTILSGAFLKWSLFAYLGMFFITFAAPILMAFISVRLKMAGSLSKYHLALQKAALYYFLAFPTGLFILFSFAKG